MPSGFRQVDNLLALFSLKITKPWASGRTSISNRASVQLDFRDRFKMIFRERNQLRADENIEWGDSLMGTTEKNQYLIGWTTWESPFQPKYWRAWCKFERHKLSFHPGYNQWGRKYFWEIERLHVVLFMVRLFIGWAKIKHKQWKKIVQCFNLR